MVLFQGHSRRAWEVWVGWKITEFAEKYGDMLKTNTKTCQTVLKIQLFDSTQISASRSTKNALSNEVWLH